MLKDLKGLGHGFTMYNIPPEIDGKGFTMYTIPPEIDLYTIPPEIDE